MDNFYRKLTIRMFTPMGIGAVIGTLLGAVGAGEFRHPWWTVAYFVVLIVGFIGCYLRARHIDKVKAIERANAKAAERARNEAEWELVDGPAVRGPRPQSRSFK